MHPHPALVGQPIDVVDAAAAQDVLAGVERNPREFADQPRADGRLSRRRFGIQRHIGRRPIAPQVSPNKSWEGAIGASVACLLAEELGGDIAVLPCDLKDREAVGATQQNVSKHLGILLAAGIVSRTKEGTASRYAIADEDIFAICELVCGGLRQQFDHLGSALQGGASR